jgi:hypothetical protein
MAFILGWGKYVNFQIKVAFSEANNRNVCPPKKIKFPCKQTMDLLMRTDCKTIMNT